MLILFPMNLDTYLSTTESAASLARKLGITPVLISQWRTGVRPVPIERCTAIEQATSGIVTRKDLRPGDYWQIWPEIDDRLTDGNAIAPLR